MSGNFWPVSSWLRVVSMALRYFSSPKMSYRMNRFLPLSLIHICVVALGQVGVPVGVQVLHAVRRQHAGAVGAAHLADAVSYTHLDVYKRQVFSKDGLLNTVLRAVTFGLAQGPEWLSDPHYALRCV